MRAVDFNAFVLVVGLLCLIVITLAVMHIAWQVP